MEFRGLGMSEHESNKPVTNTFLQMISCEGVVATVGLVFLSSWVQNIIRFFESPPAQYNSWRWFKDSYPDRLTQHLFACAVCVIFMIFVAGLTFSRALRFKVPKIRKRIRMIFISLFAIILADVLILLICDTCFVVFVL